MATDEIEYAPQQEVRLAVVLYGGVSLAIYMYGVAEELYRLVRATAPARPSAGPEGRPAGLAFAEPESTETVYRELGRRLPVEQGDDDALGPVRTRFVVDILSGTSAGGINGVCLAKALTNEADFSPLKGIWLERGDISELLNDDLAGPHYVPPPWSLLSGQLMLHNLVEAIGEMSRPQAGESRLVDELDLWVTATDLEGLGVPIKLSNATPVERRHANRYHFRYSASEGVNDFDGKADAFIAYAARSTSAFPFAFEPVTLNHLAKMADVPGDAWTRFYSAYDVEHPPPFVSRPFSDGGILDNKPFSYATDTLVGRHAALPVARKLIYVEPAPAPDTTTPPRDRWNAIDTTQAALLRLPRAETIRGDIQAVIDRNRMIERVREVVSGEHGDAARITTGPAYDVYRRLRIRGTVDYLASLLLRAAGADPESDDAFAWHYVVRAWKDERFSKDLDGFLRKFDMPYRLRRLDFVLQRVKDVDPVSEAGREALLDLRRRVADGRRGVQEAERELTMRDGALAQALGALTREELLGVLEARTDDAMRTEAARLLAGLGLDAAADELASRLDRELTKAEAACTGLAETIPTTVREAYPDFDAFDLPLYLVQFGTPIGETNPVEVVRISPDDAAGPSGVRRELFGTRLHNFGAFLDVDWRRHDMTWGRLDAAECLIHALLPGQKQRADALVGAAHEQILREYRDELDDAARKAGPDDVFEWFTKHTVRDRPNEEPTRKALRRGAVVVTHMAESALSARDAGGAAANRIAEGVRDAVASGDDDQAVAAVNRALWSHAGPQAAAAFWAVAVVIGIVLILLGDGWRLAGVFLLGVCAALAVVAALLHVLIGKGVRAGLRAAQRAVLAAVFRDSPSDPAR